MKTITKQTIALAVAAAAISVSMTPSMARSARSERAVTPSEYGAYAQYSNGNRFNAGNLQAPVSGDGYPVPGNVLNAPNQCWTDEGYGRWSSCDAGN